MSVPDLAYARPDSVAAAVETLAATPGAAVVAGSQGLVPDVKTGDAAPAALVDVGHLDALRGIRVTEGDLVVGALTTHATLAADATVAEHAPVLAAAAGEVADRQIRNRGTIGGNLAEADPAADLPAAVLAADAVLRLRGPDGEREVDTREFFQGPRETALRDDELLVDVRVPTSETAGAYVKQTHPATGWALVGVAASVSMRDGVVDAARVAATGVTESTTRLRAVEDAVTGERATAERLSTAAERATDDVTPADARGDPRASADYRVGVLPTFVERALADALGVDGGGERDA